MEIRLDRKRRARLQGAVDALVSLPASRRLSEADMRGVIEIVRDAGLTYGDFRVLDEKPGLLSGGYRAEEGGWHWKLRQVRNGVLGKQLFLALKS